MRRTAAVAWQEFRDRVAELGGRVVEPKWLGLNAPHRVVCKVGHEVTPSPSSLRLGRGLCRACAGKDPAEAERAFRQRVSELGGQVLESKWLGCGVGHRVLCSEGHESRPRPNTVQQGSGICGVCAGNDTAAAEQSFRKRVAELGGQIVEPRWLGTKKPHRVICAQGHTGHPRPNDVLQGHGLCLTCVGKNPAITERAFRDAVAQAGGQVIGPAWLGVRKLHRIICGNGHAVVALPSTVAQGGAVCQTCAGRAPGQVWGAFRSRVAELGGQVVEREWLGNSVGHRVICREGHGCTPRPADVGQGQGLCPICAGNDSATAWRTFRVRVAGLRGQVIEREWLGCDVPHRVTCQEGHETTVRPSCVRSGQGICRFCAGKSWDVFYVVTNDEEGQTKFGITSGDPRRRLQVHRRNGYVTTVRTITELTDASSLESSVLATLRLAGIPPVHGREYYDITALPVILDIADHWPRTSA